MNRRERARLQELYHRKLAKAVSTAIEPKENGDLKAGVVEAETYSKLLGLVETHWASDWIAAPIVAVFCLLAASLLWSLRVPKDGRVYDGRHRKPTRRP